MIALKYFKPTVAIQHYCYYPDTNAPNVVLLVSESGISVSSSSEPIDMAYIEPDVLLEAVNLHRAIKEAQ